MRLSDGRRGAIGREKKRAGRQEERKRKNSHHHYAKDERRNVLHLNLDLGQFGNRILFLFLLLFFSRQKLGNLPKLVWISLCRSPRSIELAAFLGFQVYVTRLKEHFRFRWNSRPVSCRSGRLTPSKMHPC